jgi:hypothetical protein
MTHGPYGNPFRDGTGDYGGAPDNWTIEPLCRPLLATPTVDDPDAYDLPACLAQPSSPYAVPHRPDVNVSCFTTVGFIPILTYSVNFAAAVVFSQVNHDNRFNVFILCLSGGYVIIFGIAPALTIRYLMAAFRTGTSRQTIACFSVLYIFLLLILISHLIGFGFGFATVGIFFVLDQLKTNAVKDCILPLAFLAVGAIDAIARISLEIIVLRFACKNVK